MDVLPPPPKEPPEGSSQVLWRYMDFAKFVSLLNDHALHFSRADQLGDNFEGSYSPPTLTERTRFWSERTKGDPEVHAEAEASQFREAPKHIFLNSWHDNLHESAAMWEMYARLGQGLAIKSTFGQLKLFCDEWPHVIDYRYISYIDFDREVMADHNLMHAYWYKRKSFEHEREFRMAIWHKSNAFRDSGLTVEPEGLGIKVRIKKLEELVNEIRIAPSAQHWLLPLARDTVKRFGLDLRVEQSELNKDPVY